MWKLKTYSQYATDARREEIKAALAQAGIHASVEIPEERNGCFIIDAPEALWGEIEVLLKGFRFGLALTDSSGHDGDPE